LRDNGKLEEDDEVSVASKVASDDESDEEEPEVSEEDALISNF